MYLKVISDMTDMYYIGPHGLRTGCGVRLVLKTIQYQITSTIIEQLQAVLWNGKKVVGTVK